jgi:hypothetical protein
MREIESVSERIYEYDQLLESMARNRYLEAERLKQIKGVGTLIAFTYMPLSLFKTICSDESGDSVEALLKDRTHAIGADAQLTW